MNQQTLKILLIEDNSDDLRLIKKILAEPIFPQAKTAFDISQVERLDRALLILTQQPFDLILMDLSLPDSRGLETVERILQAVPQLPVVVRSGMEDQELAIEAVKLGAQDYLVKGHAEEYLLPRALRYAIERKRKDRTITSRWNQESVLTNAVDVKRDVNGELELEERYQQVISSLNDHIYVTEITGEGQQLNRYLSSNVEALTGYAPEKFKADWSFWPSTVIHPEDRAAATFHFKQLTEGTSGAIEYRMVRADGQIIWVRDSGKVVQEGSSKIIYGVVGEVTARKQREHELKVITEIAAHLRIASGRADIPPIVVHQLRHLLQARGCA